jgi:hypothetical protein
VQRKSPRSIFYLGRVPNQTISCGIHIHYCVATCSIIHGPFNHFEIRANSNLKILTRISKWSNGLYTALHGVAQQWISIHCMQSSRVANSQPGSYPDTKAPKLLLWRWSDRELQENIPTLVGTKSYHRPVYI